MRLTFWPGLVWIFARCGGLREETFVNIMYTTQNIQLLSDIIYLVITIHHIYTSLVFVKGPWASPSLELSAPPSSELAASPSLWSTSSPSPNGFRYLEGDSDGSTSWIISSTISSCARSLRIGLGESIVSTKCEMHTILLQNSHNI